MRLALFFHLGGDIDMLSTFLGLGLDPAPTLIVSANLLNSNARMGALLEAYGRQPDSVIASQKDLTEYEEILAGSTHLLTCSESTLRPHKLAHDLVTTANRMGIRTGTLQHGVENIGLTYFDEFQGPEVEFASQVVLTWAGHERLLKDVCQRTRDKVVDVGLPSSTPDAVFQGYAEKVEGLPKDGSKIIGIFENLHWTRYSDAYRQNFLDDLQAATDEFPNLMFVTKPHHEGRWLSERFKGKRPENNNLLIIDPKAPGWEYLTAPSILQRMSGIVTTPSKVALDACLASIPVAVSSYDGPYAYYEDLPAIHSRKDLFSFLDALESGDPGYFKCQSEQFLAATISSVDRPERVIQALF